MRQRNLAVVKTLTYAMFAMFAMTTDSVGIIIPEVIRTFRLSLTAAGSFQYATMGGIALAALLLGQLADRIGRRRTIIAGLTLFAAACFLITTGDSFVFFAALLGLSGIAIGVFKTGALALIGDLSSSTTEHTSIMNMLEGFFGIGAIVGPAVLARLLGAGLPWTRLYLLAGAMCAILIVVASLVQYPETARSTAASGVRRHRRRREEPLRPRVLDGSVSLRRRRGGRVRLDADAAGGIFGQRRGPGGVRRIRSSFCCGPPDGSSARGC